MLQFLDGRLLAKATHELGLLPLIASGVLDCSDTKEQASGYRLYIANRREECLREADQCWERYCGLLRFRFWAGQYPLMYGKAIEVAENKMQALLLAAAACEKSAKLLQAIISPLHNLFYRPSGRDCLVRMEVQRARQLVYL